MCLSIVVCSCFSGYGDYIFNFGISILTLENKMKKNKQSERFDNWVAVQYDYSTDKELQREELKDWLFISSL